MPNFHSEPRFSALSVCSRMYTLRVNEISWRKESCASDGAIMAVYDSQGLRLVVRLFVTVFRLSSSGK